MQSMVLTSPFAPVLLAMAMSGALGGCSTETLPEGSAVTKDDGRAMGGKSDRDGDICEDLGWYGDGECDEFCPVYDEADCDVECAVDADCPRIRCIRAPCPFTVCVAGQCLIDVSEDDCVAGERECAGCNGAVECIAQSAACAVPSCPVPAAACGSRGLEPCPDGQFCDFPEAAQCGASDSPGSCSDRPTGCTREYAPVCGCDITTYANACSAHAVGVSVASAGECG